MAALRNKLFLACTTLLLLCSPCESFLPNHLNGFFGGKTSNDYTHQDITEQGILMAVATIMEENPRAGTTIRPGSLTSIDPLTSQVLFDKYYGAGVQATKLKSAIDEIVQANNQVDIVEADSAKHHFNGEQIKDGNLVLQILRDNLINILKSSSPDYDAAREMVGKYLHTLQMFYSNTNWVEMYGETAYANLGITGKPLMAVAPKAVPTCKSCETTIFGTRDPCDGNIIVKDMLTSGYKIGQDVAKPAPAVFGTKGKCSHGGAPDTSRYFPATGGINKDTSDENLSPHAKLHKTAGKAAIKATTLFFDNQSQGTGLRQVVGDDKVKELLRMRSGSSLALVIDISGSMSNDIAAVKTKVNEIILKTAGTPNAPYNYILSTFSDPTTIGSVRVTKDNAEIRNWIAALTVNGGGDCPEYSMLGLERALKVALPNSKVYVFTDADAKDPERMNSIVAMVQAKKIVLEFLLTGKCSSRKRRAFQQGQVESQQNRQKRSGTTEDLGVYELLAKKSGGEVINTDKTHIGDVTGTITEESWGTTTPLFKLKLKPRIPVTFSIDDTTSAITLHVTGDPASKPNVNVLGPEGIRVSNITILVDSKGIKVLQIPSPLPGTWTIIGADDLPYTVEITGATPFSFKYTFVEEKRAGYWLPINGNPIVGRNLTMLVETVGHNHIEKLTNLQLNGLSSGDVIATYRLVQGAGRMEGSYRVNLELTSESVRVQIVGLDKENNTVVRTVPTPLVADSVKLEVYEPSGDLRAGSSVSMNFNIINYGTLLSFKVNARTDPGYAVALNPSRFSLQLGETGSGSIIITAPSTATPYTTTSLTVTVTDDMGKLYSSAMRRMLVLESLRKETTSVVTSTPEVITSAAEIILETTTSNRILHSTEKTHRTIKNAAKATTPGSDKKDTNINIIIGQQGLGAWEIVAIVIGSAFGTLLVVAIAMLLAKNKDYMPSGPFRRRTFSEVSMVSTGKIGY